MTIWRRTAEVDRQALASTIPPGRPIPIYHEVAGIVRLEGKGLYITTDEWDENDRNVMQALGYQPFTWGNKHENALSDLSG